MLAKFLQPNLQSKPQREGTESEQFWDLLGGKSEYPSQKISREAESDPHLFCCSFSNGKWPFFCLLVIYRSPLPLWMQTADFLLMFFFCCPIDHRAGNLKVSLPTDLFGNNILNFGTYAMVWRCAKVGLVSWFSTICHL